MTLIIYFLLSLCHDQFLLCYKLYLFLIVRHLSGAVCIKMMQNQVLPPPARSCHSKVELHISCTNLLDKDVMSKSDPLCVLYIEQGERFYEVW